MKKLSLLNLKVIREKDFDDSSGLGEKITSPDVIADILVNKLEIHEQDVESLYLFTLDTNNSINGIFEVSRGTLNSSIISPREIFKRAMLQNANSIILAHNHPSGSTKPSVEDITASRRIVSIGKMIQIPLLDHIIIGTDTEDFTSIKQLGYLDEERESPFDDKMLQAF